MDGYSQHGTATRGTHSALDMTDADVRGAAASPVLPLALSAQLGLDPADLVALRSDLFPHPSAPTLPRENMYCSPCLWALRVSLRGIQPLKVLYPMSELFLVLLQKDSIFGQGFVHLLRRPILCVQLQIRVGSWQGGSGRHRAHLV